MRFAVVKRDEMWLAQAVYIGENLHWTEHQRIQHEIARWVSENCTGYAINGWQFYFADEKDLHWFLLRWS